MFIHCQMLIHGETRATLVPKLHLGTQLSPKLCFEKLWAADRVELLETKAVQLPKQRRGIPKYNLGTREKRKVARASSLRWFGGRLEACATPCDKIPNARSASRQKRSKNFRPINAI